MGLVAGVQHAAYMLLFAPGALPRRRPTCEQLSGSVGLVDTPDNPPEL